MNKKLKIGLGGAALLLGAVLLTGCTASFCSVKDQAHLLYAYDPGVTKYYDENANIAGAEPLKIYDENSVGHEVEGVVVTYSFNNSQALKATVYSAKTNGYVGPTWDGDEKTGHVVDDPKYLEYYKRLDNIVLIGMLKEELGSSFSFDSIKKEHILNCTYGDITGKGIGDIYGNIKFSNPNEENPVLWDNYDNIYANKATESILKDPRYGSLDYCPSTDFVNHYKSTMNTYAGNNTFRSCLVTNTGFYGTYTNDKVSVLMESKSYGYAWSKGFFEGLLVWPIGAFIDVCANSFGFQNPAAAQTAVPQLLAILVVTFVIRTLMLLATFKSTNANAKMTALQPEITKIQNKYPNSNTNRYEKQRMAEEMQKLYKKNKINPFSSIVVLIIQFPVFICVWGALSGSAILTTGTFLGLDLGASISTVLFNLDNWGPAGGYGAVTALVLFLLMAAAQTVSMLLHQWMQKAKAKKVAKLGKNPSQAQQNNKMKWFTYIMLGMIVIMGFSLVSAMGVYWLVGALFSIIQTLITQAVMNKKQKQN